MDLPLNFDQFLVGMSFGFVFILVAWLIPVPFRAFIRFIRN